MYWLRLIRWPNLLIVLLTQLLAWVCVIMPLKRHIAGVWLMGDLFDFAAVCGSTLLVAAAGYIINDYFDIKIDAINRPEKVLLAKKIPRKMAILAHIALNGIALWLSVLVAVKYHHLSWVGMQLICIVLLWFYSTHFKRMFMLGNVVVALLTAFTIVTLVLYQPVLHPFFRLPVLTDMPGAQVNPVYVLGVYMLFAFFLTWMREIVKDMEDFKGDAEQGCVTMPIRWGLQKAAYFIALLGIITILLLLAAAAVLFLSRTWWLFAYAVLFIILPLVRWLFILFKGATTAHYHRISRQLKWIMVSGIGSLILYYFEYA